MAVAPFNKSTFEDFNARLNNVSADSERQWGTLDATAMLRHLRFVFEASLGEVDTHGQAAPGLGWVPKTPGVRDLMFLISFKWFTDWPKGKLKAPKEWTPPSEQPFDEEGKQLLQKMEQFVDELAATPDKRTFSPLLGYIPLTKWSVVHGAHMNHHLKQFGV
jgi:hypothetical protein